MALRSVLGGRAIAMAKVTARDGKPRPRLLLASVFLIIGVAPAWATSFIAYDLSPTGVGTLYDATDVIGPNNPRTTVPGLIDIEFDGTGTLYGLAEGVNPLLYRINPTTGAATPIGTGIGLGFVFHGDLAYDPTSNSLYGFAELFTTSQTCCVNLFKIDTTTGLATVVGGVDFAHSFVSMMSFDGAGDLWIINQNQALGGSTLVHLDKTTAAVLSEVPLSLNLLDAGGMDFDPATSTMFGATTILFSVDTSTGVVTGLQGGLSFLADTRGLAVVPEAPAAVPEPTSLLLLGSGLALGWVRRRLIGRRRDRRTT